MFLSYSLENNYKTSHSLFICRQLLHSPVSVCMIHMIDTECMLWFIQLEINELIPVVSVDLEKAFDSAARSKMWNTITRFGIPVPIFNLWCFACQIVHEGKPSALVSVISGVRQGFFMSPRIFLMIMGGEVWNHT